MTGQGQILVGEVGWQAIVAAGWDPDFVGGLTLGADPVAYAIARHATATGRTVDAFTVRKAAKGHGAGRRIEGGLEVGARVVVVDDTATSGGSLLRAVEAVRDHGAEVLGVLTVVDREEGAKERLAAAGYGFVACFSSGELLAAARDRLVPGE